MNPSATRRGRGRPRLSAAQHRYLFPRVYAVRLGAVDALHLEGLRQQRGLTMSALIRQLVRQGLAQAVEGVTPGR
jgi:hypothetical protein